jgi:threonine dehydrogenase-like Zn-dependent dehydrogenase
MRMQTDARLNELQRAIGMTAYVGLLEIGQPKPGETVVVAAASGAVGSVVGQIAKIKGCRAIGIAGGAEKCRFVTGELGFDACVDHRAPDFAKQLEAACSKGIRRRGRADNRLDVVCEWRASHDVRLGSTTYGNDVRGHRMVHTIRNCLAASPGGRALMRSDRRS